MEFEFDTQVQLIMALCCLHNFIRLESDSDDKFDKAVEDERALKKKTVVLHKALSQQEKNRAKALRDQIAEDMWHQYSRHGND
jgi:hypothetical protein